jgi:hypothetical protein
MLDKQLQKFHADWSLVQELLTSAGTTAGCFKYYWAIVNSRCYYWKYATSRRPAAGAAQLPAEECLALCPVADLFNHDNDGVRYFLCSPSG